MSAPWEEYQAQGPWSEYGASPKAQPPSAPVKIGADAFQDTLKSELANTDWLTRNIAGAGSAVMNALNGIAGKGVTGELDPEAQAWKTIANEAPVGNIAGNVAMLAPTAMIPGANTVTGAATIGAVSGTALTPGDLKERLQAALMGGAGGAAGAKLSQVMAKAAPLQAATNPNASLLEAEGIGLTPGQSAGGVLKNLEDKATSIPFVGNIIQNARRRGVEEFNKAAYKRAALPGMQIDEVGRDGVAALRTGLGEAYDDVLSRSSANALEPEFVNRIASLRQMASSLPDKERAAFDAIIDREIGARMAPNGFVNAENLQAAKSGLGQQATNFTSSTDAYQRQLGQAIKQAEQEFRDLVARANPQNAADLKMIDKAYANFKRIQRAASGVGADEGVFTPAQLNSAVKAMDKSKDKRAFSEGNALLQDLTEAGKAVLPSKVPDSGTAGRVAANLFSLGGLTSSAGGLIAALPAYAAYSRPGSAAINATVKGAKGSAVSLANLVRELSANNPNLARILGTVGPMEFVRN